MNRRAQGIRQGIRDERGNAFFFIFLGVILFAALMFTVSRGTQMASGGIGKQQARVAVAEITDFTQKMERAVNKMTQKTVSETELSFEIAVNVGYANANCLDATCKLFDPAGGNVTYIPPSTKWLDKSHSAMSGFGQWAFMGDIELWAIGNTCGAADCAELVAVLPYLQVEICKELNAALGVQAASGVPTLTAPVAIHKFTGTFGYQESFEAANFSGSDPAMRGRASGCIKTQDGYYAYVHTLVAR